MNAKFVSTLWARNGSVRKSTVMGFAAAAALTLLGASSSQASVIDLGAAGGYSILTYNSSNVSDSAFQGGPIGVVNGNWTQSGGGQTNTQQATTVFLSPGHTNGGPSVETTVFDAAKLNASWSAATALSSTLAALAPTDTLGAISSGGTISKSTVGTYVLSISSINLNQSALTLSAPAGSTFVLNISGNVTLNGGSAGNGILLAGGLTSSNVIYNLTGANSNITTSGGGNAQQIFGTVLATGANASVNLHPGAVLGEVIATTFTSSSGALVSVPPMTSVPEPSSFLPLVGVLGMVVGGSTIRRRLAAAA